MLQHNPVQKTEKYRLYFEKNTNVSIAASAKETIFSKSLEGVFKELSVLYDGDNTTGSVNSTFTLTLDSVVVIDALAFSVIYKHFCGEGSSSVSGGGGILNFLKYDAANKKWAFKIHGDITFHDTLLVEITNADNTNAAALHAGLIYGIPI